MRQDGAKGQSGDGDGDATVRIFTPGQEVFARYILRRKLGQGGMGVVWLAEDQKLKRDVALKFLPENVRLDPASLEDLRREARKCLDLTHPGIVRIYDFVDGDEAAAISMEYVDGSTMSKLRVERERFVFEAAELGPWVSQLCAALDYAHHEAKLVHRDLKPSNLLVNSKGRLKVADFGIARSISDSASRVSAQITSGTLAYMSPQQTRGDRPSEQDDIYSLGATLFELLTGRPPFYSGDITLQILEKVPPSMAARREELGVKSDPIPANWEETVAACLAKDARKRPANVAEVASRLGVPVASLASGSSTETITLFPRSGTGSTDFKNWLMVGVAAILVLLLVISWIVVGHKFGGVTNNASQMQTERKANKGVNSAASQRIFTPVVPSFTNSLGMRFVSVGEVQMSIWDTRVQDFEAFIKATGHDAVGKDAITFDATGWATGGTDWKHPGFDQTAEHPVVDVNWYDAQAFCHWLTATERQNGVLRTNQFYRLPTEGEWMEAAGQTRYVWGDKWPPPADAANLAGAEVIKEGHWPANTKPIAGFEDAFARTSPVGSFKASQSGLYDLIGNVWQWCDNLAAPGKEDRITVGSAWTSAAQDTVDSNVRAGRPPKTRMTSLGFRCVLVEEKVPATNVTGNLISATFTNTLGMRFAPVGKLLFSIWETRVQDFKAYTKATGYEQTGPMICYGKDGWKRGVFTWNKLPFKQDETHPVSGVDWQEAADFCAWLTRKERTEGKIKPDEEYRLPTSAEWSAAAGPERYPWGPEWPPPPGAGNFGGEEILQDENWQDTKDMISGYNDRYSRSSPVGVYNANKFGLYDMAGNVWEWCQDWFDETHREKVLRGGSWRNTNPANFETSFVSKNYTRDHVENNGFRCVLANVSTRSKAAIHGPMDVVFTNTLAMEFVKLPNTKVLFSIWETRVGDFAAFVDASHYDATAGMRAFTKSNQWQELNGSWRNPGFPQNKDHPVVGVSWLDAVAFCEWLNQREHANGTLGPAQHYRLPTQAEWDVAVGPDIYPWGNTSSPPERTGNYAGIEVVNSAEWPTGREVLWDYTDFFNYTAPVGSFYPNRLGIYDLAGNAREWCQDDAPADVGLKITMGGAWDSNRLETCLSHKPQPLLKSTRNTTTGFRCVIEGEANNLQ